jgi:hypothetical protein
MKITESQLKTIILEEAAKVRKAVSLKKELAKVQKQLDEVLGGPHGGGKKTFKKAEGGFKENQGALVEKEVVEGFVDDNQPKIPGGFGKVEETFDFSEEELQEMLNMADDDMTQEVAPVASPMAETTQVEESTQTEEEVVEEADKTSDPFTVDAPKEFQLKESAEILRMKKLAGLLK